MSKYLGKQGWLQCEKVVRGMFSDELAVVVKRSNGEQVSYFVPMQDVDKEQGRVRVSVREVDSFLWATLPTPYHDTIAVEKSSVVMT